MKNIKKRQTIFCIFIISVFSLLFHLTFNSSLIEVNKSMIAMNHSSAADSKITPIEIALETNKNELSPITRDEIKIVPGGQSIGVQLQTLGALVVGHHSVQGKDGKQSPGKDAKVHVGDVILKMNGHTIKGMEEVKPFVKKAGENGEALKVTLKRDGKIIETSLNPVYDKNENEYKIGLYIKDSAAGIGTMTFHDPITNRFGALGHVISDINTKKPIEMAAGTIVRSSITAIQKGSSGSPGEKQAKFSMDRNKLGTINKNTPYGIFGVLDTEIKNGKYDKTMGITRAHEVKEGPAKILTVVEDEKVEEFDIEIISSVPQEKPDIKGMVIKVTDEDLLKRTGGIVQGMSGSPIIQDNKIVGAVTHVFVNDPTSGYGGHIEWMLNDAELNFTKKIAN